MFAEYNSLFNSSDTVSYVPAASASLIGMISIHSV